MCTKGLDVAISSVSTDLHDGKKDGFNQPMDRLGMPLCLIYHPRVVATAALLLAWHFSYENQPPTDWWATTGLDPAEINGK